MRAANQLKIYIDGKLAATQPNVQSLDLSSNALLRIGFGPQSTFTDSLRNVRLYNRALSVADLKSSK